MSMNIEGLTAQQLSDLITRANKRKKILAKRKPAAQVKAAVAKVLKTSGWSFEELYGNAGAAPATRTPVAKATRAKSSKGRSMGKVPPKYRNPANSSETWTGRGRQPRWLAAETAAGKKLEDFLIS